MEYGCIAKKLSHSFSREIHNMLFDYDYELCEVAEDQLDSFMKQHDFKAINVTIPYKEAVIPYLDEISDTARRIGAVNTIVNRNGKLIGYNTDFSGLKSLIEHTKIQIQGKKVLILGSGGTSKTAYAVAQHLGCCAVYRVSRSGRDGCITYEQASNLHSDAQIIINTTPCGMYPDLGKSAVNPDDYPRLEGVVDAVYNPLRSKLVCDALKKGIPATGGLYMLVAQAAHAAEKFIGRSVSQEKINRIYECLVSKKQNIVLIGMPGCGKTTIGTALANALKMDFIDTDCEVIKADGREITEIFAESGENTFRDLETAAISCVSSLQGCIIATGGGAILRTENIEMLRENGRIYFIDAPLETLIPTASRPLSSNRHALEQRYTERYELYCRSCDCHIHSEGDIKHAINQIKKDLNYENISTERT